MLRRFNGAFGCSAWGIRCQDTACNSDDPQRPTQITMFLRLFPLMMISLPLLTGEACGLVGGAQTLASGEYRSCSGRSRWSE